MSASDRIRGNAPARPEGPAPAPIAPMPPIAPSVPAPGDPYAGWLDRMQRGRGRHSAITRNLGNIANYRNWADRMKGSFDEEPKRDAVPPPPGSSRR